MVGSRSTFLLYDYICRKRFYDFDYTPTLWVCRLIMQLMCVVMTSCVRIPFRARIQYSITLIHTNFININAVPFCTIYSWLYYRIFSVYLEFGFILKGKISIQMKTILKFYMILFLHYLRILEDKNKMLLLVIE